MATESVAIVCLRSFVYLKSLTTLETLTTLKNYFVLDRLHFGNQKNKIVILFFFLLSICYYR